MGLFDALLGRTKPVRPDLDQLFGLPSAAITLQASLGYTFAGVGSVCFKAAEGQAAAQTESEIAALLAVDGAEPPDSSRDQYGYTWLSVRNPELDEVVTSVHAINSTLEGNGWGSLLLCSVFAFTGPQRQSLGMVYLYKRGAFYPFVPTGPDRRDNPAELAVRVAIGSDLRIEEDLQRWFGVWGAPGL